MADDDFIPPIKKRSEAVEAMGRARDRHAADQMMLRMLEEQQRIRMQRKVPNRPGHSSDADCAPYLLDGECSVCHVTHGDPCETCGGRGWHKDGCDEIDRP